jgi:hypothetical protein
MADAVMPEAPSSPTGMTGDEARLCSPSALTGMSIFRVCFPAIICLLCEVDQPDDRNIGAANRVALFSRWAAAPSSVPAVPNDGSTVRQPAQKLKPDS